MTLSQRLYTEGSAAPRFRSVALTHIGRVRQVNEDRLLDCPERGLWAVADGMGGHSAGDVAATIAVRALNDVASVDGAIGIDAIEVALDRANLDMRDQVRGQPSGSTLAGLLLDGDTFTTFWVGDSRVYRYRDGRLEPLTHDHSLVQELVDSRMIPAASAARHPQANVVTRALGVAGSIEMDRREGTVAPGDRFLLCSDGLTALVSEAEIARILAQPIDQAAPRLVAAALDAGGFDNITAILVAAS